MYGIYENGKIIAGFVAPIKVISNKPVFVSDTLSLKRATFSRTAQRWEIETNLEPLVETAHDLFVNLVTKGYSETITILMPQNYGVILKRTSTATPTATQAVAGSSSVVVTNNSGLIPKGTFIKFAEHSKIYMTTNDLSGNGTLGIYPALKTATSGIFKHRDDVLMSCLYDTTTVVGMAYTDGILMDIGSVKLVEKLA
jgi:hypothetical protein